MLNYIYSGKYNFNEEMNKINDSLIKETKGNLESLEVNFDMDDDLDSRTFLELAIYKNHKDLNCVLDEYLSKNKFRNKEKVDFLKSMRESFISLFKIISTDYDGYVELEDLLTGKKVYSY